MFSQTKIQIEKNIPRITFLRCVHWVTVISAYKSNPSNIEKKSFVGPWKDSNEKEKKKKRQGNCKAS